MIIKEFHSSLLKLDGFIFHLKIPWNWGKICLNVIWRAKRTCMTSPHPKFFEMVSSKYCKWLFNGIIDLIVCVSLIFCGLALPRIRLLYWMAKRFLCQNPRTHFLWFLWILSAVFAYSCFHLVHSSRHFYSMTHSSAIVFYFIRSQVDLYFLSLKRPKAIWKS